MNIRHLRAFAEVVATGRMSAGARRVHLSQSAVTKAVANLEATVGAALLTRHPAGVIATQSGERLANRAGRALALLRDGAARTRALGQRVTDTAGLARFDQSITNAHLTALIAVAAAENFSLAARRIGLSQPTVHKSARELERLAGVALFRRQGQSIALTQAAEPLARAARLAFVELAQARDEIASLQGVERGLLRIGTLPLVRSKFLPDAINRFTSDFSGDHRTCQFDIVDGPYDELLRSLLNGDIDLLLGALRDPAPVKDVIQTPLFGDQLAVVARRGHPLAAARRIVPRDLSRFAWIVPKSGSPTRRHFDGMFAATGAPLPDQLIEASSLVLIRGLLMGSDRLALISRHQVALEVANDMLVYLAVALDQQPRAIGMTVRRQWSPTPVQAAFLEHLTRTAAAMRHPT